MANKDQIATAFAKEQAQEFDSLYLRVYNVAQVWPLLKDPSIRSCFVSEQSASDDPIIICRNVNKWYGEYHALRDFSLTVQRKEVVVIIGPSGSGKSTFIRTINRLEEHQSGDIIVDGIPLTADIGNIEAIRMETGMVFQQFNFFPT